jgi:hypothetical protein
MYALECGDYCDSITWSSTDGGMSFYILDPKAFAELVLPALFKVAKYDSFQRKLYRWGFMKKQRSRAGNAIISYGHQLFRKGNFALVSTMTCSGTGSASRRITSDFITSPVVGIPQNTIKHHNAGSDDCYEDVPSRMFAPDHYAKNGDVAGGGGSLLSTSCSAASRFSRDPTIAAGAAATFKTLSLFGGYSPKQYQQQQQQQRLYQQSMLNQQSQVDVFTYPLSSSYTTTRSPMRSSAPASSSAVQGGGSINLFASRKNVLEVPRGGALLPMTGRRGTNEDAIVSTLRRDSENYLFDGQSRTCDGKTMNIIHGNMIPARSHPSLADRRDGSCTQQYPPLLPARSSRSDMDPMKQLAIMKEALDALHNPSFTHEF